MENVLGPSEDLGPVNRNMSWKPHKTQSGNSGRLFSIGMSVENYLHSWIKSVMCHSRKVYFEDLWGKAWCPLGTQATMLLEGMCCMYMRRQGKWQRKLVFTPMTIGKMSNPLVFTNEKNRYFRSILTTLSLLKGFPCINMFCLCQLSVMSVPWRSSPWRW